MAKKQKKLVAKAPRNWHAVNAQMRNSAGAMSDRKKERSRKACRGKPQPD